MHSYNNRRGDDYRYHQCPTNAIYFCIFFQGPKIWNSLPNVIGQSETSSKFITESTDIPTLKIGGLAKKMFPVNAYRL